MTYCLPPNQRQEDLGRLADRPLQDSKGGQVIQGGGEPIVGRIDRRWDGNPTLLVLMPVVQGQGLLINTLHFGVGVGDDQGKGLSKMGHRATVVGGGIDGKDLTQHLVATRGRRGGDRCHYDNDRLRHGAGGKGQHCLQSF